tara:strand:+ start:671 stop:880 length:210 start_codon:yes stop_codon:yes gene_type:complete
MCLGGGSVAPPAPRYLNRVDPPPGPASPPDMVNDIEVSDTGNYNRDQLKADTGKAKPGAQTTKSYGGAA